MSRVDKKEASWRKRRSEVCSTEVTAAQAPARGSTGRWLETMCFALKLHSGVHEVSSPKRMVGWHLFAILCDASTSEQGLPGAVGRPAPSAAQTACFPSARAAACPKQACTLQKACLKCGRKPYR